MGKKGKKHTDLVPSGNHHNRDKHSVQVAHVSQTKFSGPLPHPEILARYEQIQPGAADRIIAMAEAQSRHRQDLETKAIDSDIKNSRTGLHYGLIIGLATILSGAACIFVGQQWGGIFLGGAGLTGLVGVFVYGSREKKIERKKRLEKMLTGGEERQPS
jgi:uncharacterized membrane protein